MRLRILLLTITFCMILLTTVCSRNNNTSAPEGNATDKTPPEKIIITEEDITNLGSLTVSVENPGGAVGEEGSSKLVDGNTKTKFLIDPFQPGFYMQLSFDTAKLVAAYTLTTGNDAAGRDPRDWTITASNDGIHWVELDKQTGELFRDRELTKRYDFKNNIKYRFYRWNVQTTYFDKLFQIAEWRLLQVPEKDQKISPVTFTDTTTKDGLTLIFVNKTGTKNLAYQSKLTTTFFTNYPKLIHDFNKDAKRKLLFIIDPTYDGVAYAIGNQVVISPAWLQKHPTDIDLITHEIMHHVQAYSGGAAPGWLTEGIADYVRYKYGLDNVGAGWSLPDYKPSQKYTDAYRVTARFLAWIELHKKKGFVKNLDAAIRAKTYTSDFWVANTGKTVDALWQEYAANPVL